ncbi:MAG: MBOAT family protein [Deltaproteobacteria bacterium]|nr:MBOAT family protein [Deltaproteobacteria bacterium]
MIFSSVFFLFAFLPIVILGHFFLPEKFRNLFLLLASLLFYFWGENWLVFIVIASVTANYACGILISGAYKPGPIAPAPEARKHRLRKKTFLALSIAVNLGLLVYFKYANFMVLDVLGELIGANARLFDGWQEILLPLGISFYTFQSMSYVIDVYRGKTAATRSFIDFACYVTCFPQLVAGPIVRYRDIAGQLVRRIVTPEGFAEGIGRFVTGLSKKVIIANTVGKTADAVFALPPDNLDAPHAWLGVLCYTLQIYFDFSGYSDMAIGLGRMLGFRYLENFNYPYVASSVQEFWRRWHISLSTWFRDYLYIPLGGNRGSRLRTYLNLWTVFILCGLWHGASWNFLAWGAYHGLFLVFERAGFNRILERAPKVVGHVYTVFVVMTGWMLFRADTLNHAWLTARAAFGFGAALPQAVSIRYYLGNDVLAAVGLGILFSMPVTSYVGSRAPFLRFHRYHWARYIALALLLLVCSMRLANDVYNPFIYFRF